MGRGVKEVQHPTQLEKDREDLPERWQLGLDWKNKQELARIDDVGSRLQVERQHKKKQEGKKQLPAVWCPWNVKKKLDWQSHWWDHRGLGLHVFSLFCSVQMSSFKKTSPAMPHRAHNFRYVKKMCFVRNGDSLRLLQTVITATRVAWGNSFLHCVSWGHCFVFAPSGLLYYNFPKNRKIHVHEVFCLKWCKYIICCWVTKLYPSLCNPTDCSTPGFSVPHHLLEFVQGHVR